MLRYLFLINFTLITALQLSAQTKAKPDTSRLMKEVVVTYQADASTMPIYIFI